MLSDAREALQRVLNPVSYDDFFNSYVGKRPLIIKDNNPFRAAIGGNISKGKITSGTSPVCSCGNLSLSCPQAAPTCGNGS